MAKKTARNANQLPLEPKKKLPQMPEGYYSSGPNPNLHAFVEHQTKTSIPSENVYDREAFNETIVDDSDSTIYDMHPYWSKKPHGAIAQYIRHYTKIGDLILDPFLGSGGTVAVAAQLGRSSVGIDISPAATFIAKHLCTPFSLETIQASYESMIADLHAVKERLYQTVCHKCGGHAETQYIVWSQTYKCLKCLNVVSHYECDNQKCPHCGEKISTRQERLGYVPVLANIQCAEGDGRLERGIRSKNIDYRKAFEKFDLPKLAEIDASNIPYWYPTDPFPREWISWRPNLGEIKDVSGFYTKRNLWAAASIVDWIDKHNSEPATSWLMLALTGSIMSISKKAQHLEGGGGYIPGNYVFPPEIKERNVFNTYESIFRKLLKGVEALNSRISTTSVLISTQSSLNLHEIPDNTIDYIFTDPPYSDKVPFGEFNFLWEVWLRFGTSWDKDEIMVNPKLGKGFDEWKQMMKSVVTEMYRVLKPNHWASICYHDSAEGSWMFLQDVFAEVGFLSENADAVLSIERTRKSWKQNTAEKVQKRDLVINFRKPHSDEVTPALVLVGDEDSATFTEKARSILHEALMTHPGSTGDRLYDELVSRMVRRGEFERHNFDALLRGVAEQGSNGRWYLLDSADQTDAAEANRESKVMRTLEKFAQDWLKENPEAEGVHYSDLFERYLPIPKGDKPRRSLIDLLPEYFIKTTDGTWRLPEGTEVEKLRTLRESGALRRIRRFANALIEGVAPAERDRPTNAATAGEWIRQCRRAGLYAQGRAIYEAGGFSFSGLSEEAQLEIEEDYQICARRSI